MAATEEIAVDRLKEGMFIQLNDWIGHPFVFSSFKIKNKKQLAILRSLGLQSVTWVPSKSDTTPEPAKKTTEPPAPPLEAAEDPEIAAMWEEKQKRIAKVAQRKEAVVETEKKFAKTVSSVKGLMKKLFAKPEEAVKEATEVVTGIVDSLLGNKDIAIHLMNNKNSDENTYYHVMNVTMLSLILAKEAGIPREIMHELGMGALLHDIGKERIQSSVLMNRDHLSKPEASLFQMHTTYGLDMAQNIPVSRAVKDIILHHHEMVDGSGYPDKLTGDRMNVMTKIISLVNAYDNYCNKLNPAESLSPSEALSYIFKNQRAQFDSTLLKLFIRSMGVYPPGSIVQLSNDDIGIVTSVTPDKLLQPSVLIYDPKIPKDEAIYFDLDDEPDLVIVKSLRPGQLDRDVYDYLSPRARINYFIDRDSKANK